MEENVRLSELLKELEDGAAENSIALFINGNEVRSVMFRY